MYKKGIWFIMEWVWKLVYVNLVWILFCLPVITIIPSTFALLAVANKWFKEDEEIDIFPTFWKQFKGLFWKSYLYGLTFIIIGFFLFLNLQLVNNGELDGPFFLTVHYALLVTSILYCVTMIYSVPLYLNFGFSVHKTLFFGLMVALKQPIITIMVLIGVLLTILAFVFITGFGFLFVGSLPALMMCKSNHYAMKKLKLT
ncbi:YesL family protein [Halalkalibacter kiskunsagensis]|uniref:YesL family protein n=1 Tax=Halalkalibacter kiskunsagensis TaxID=1548599 RepID=A0ABV6KFM4_9BACI